MGGLPSLPWLVVFASLSSFKPEKTNEIANTRRVLACVWLPCACSFGCGSSASLGVTRATTTNERRRQGQPHRRQGFAPASPLPLRGDLLSPPCRSGHSPFPLGGGFPCPPWGGGLPFPPLGTTFSSLFSKATYPVDLAKKCPDSWQRQSFYHWLN